jgi:threonine/homoserine/homoserine lactone efflux protein
MPETQTLLLFAAASAALIAVPGPSVLYIVARGMDQGRRAGLISVLGIECGALVHVTAAAIGVSAIIASSATAFSVLKYAGAAYLVYLGVRKLRERVEETEDEATPRSRRRLFWEGALVNALNPKTATFFVAFLPQFVDPQRGAVVVQVLVLGLLFVAVAIVCDSLWALLAGTVRRQLRSFRARRVMARLSGSVYIGLGAAAALGEGRPARR